MPGDNSRSFLHFGQKWNPLYTVSHYRWEFGSRCSQGCFSDCRACQRPGWGGPTLGDSKWGIRALVNRLRELLPVLWSKCAQIPNFVCLLYLERIQCSSLCCDRRKREALLRCPRQEGLAWTENRYKTQLHWRWWEAENASLDSYSR